MRKFALLLAVLGICTEGANAIDFMKNLQKILPIQSPGKSEEKTPENLMKMLQEVIPFQAQPSRGESKPADTRCEAMLNNTPKASLADETAKNILKGAVIGAAAGAMLDSNRGRGAIIGAMTGAAAATAYTMQKTKDRQPEDYESTAKRVGYKPSQGDFVEVKLISNKDKTYKLGEYAEVVLRVSALTSDKEAQIPVWISAYLVGKDGRMLPLGTENYTMLGGTSPFVYYFPICDDVKEGSYKLRFQVTTLGRLESHEVELKVSGK